MPRLATLATAAAAVLLLTACAGSPVAGAPAATTAADQPATGTSTSTAVSLAPGERPTLAFAGDCDEMVTRDEIDGLVGADVMPIADEPEASVSAVEALGGLTCAWGGGDYAFTVFLTAIPAGGFEERIAEFAYPGDRPDCWAQNAAGVEGACSFSRIVDGYWLAGLFQVESGTGLVPAESIEALAAIVGERASDHPATPVVFPSGTWRPTECGALAAGVAEELSTDAPGAVSGSVPNGFVGPGPTGAERFAGASRCVWSGTHGFTTDLLPGAGWAIDRFADAAPIDVDGTTAAVRQQLGDGSGRITATDGVNLAWITVPESASDAEAAAFLSMVMRAAG